MAIEAIVAAGVREERTRVNLFLPADDYKDRQAIFRVVGYLKEQRHSTECPINGFTSTVLPESPFWGIWSRGQDWVVETVALVIIDYAKRDSDETLKTALQNLKNAIENSYLEVGRKQDVVWVTGERVWRVV
jgi:hypothetical protein